jgi:hypothetical protein
LSSLAVRALQPVVLVKRHAAADFGSGVARSGGFVAPQEKLLGVLQGAHLPEDRFDDLSLATSMGPA